MERSELRVKISWLEREIEKCDRIQEDLITHLEKKEQELGRVPFWHERGLRDELNAIVNRIDDWRTYEYKLREDLEVEKQRQSLMMAIEVAVLKARREAELENKREAELRAKIEAEMEAQWVAEVQAKVKTKDEKRKLQQQETEELLEKDRVLSSVRDLFVAEPHNNGYEWLSGELISLFEEDNVLRAVRLTSEREPEVAELVFLMKPEARDVGYKLLFMDARNVTAHKMFEVILIHALCLSKLVKQMNGMSKWPTGIGVSSSAYRLFWYGCISYKTEQSRGVSRSYLLGSYKVDKENLKFVTVREEGVKCLRNDWVSVSNSAPKSLEVVVELLKHSTSCLPIAEVFLLEGFIHGQLVAIGPCFSLIGVVIMYIKCGWGSDVKRVEADLQRKRALKYHLVILGTASPTARVSVKGGGSKEKAQVIQTQLIIAGLNILLQMLFGAKLIVDMGHIAATPVIRVPCPLQWGAPKLDPDMQSTVRLEKFLGDYVLYNELKGLFWNGEEVMTFKFFSNIYIFLTLKSRLHLCVWRTRQNGFCKGQAGMVNICSNLGLLKFLEGDSNTELSYKTIVVCRKLATNYSICMIRFWDKVRMFDEAHDFVVGVQGKCDPGVEHYCSLDFENVAVIQFSNGVVRRELLVGTVSIFTHMLGNGIYPDNYTMPYLLKVCAKLKDCSLGEIVHGYYLKLCLVFDVSVGNLLIPMYSAFGDMRTTGYVFNEIPEIGAAFWTVMISRAGWFAFSGDEALRVNNSNDGYAVTRGWFLQSKLKHKERSVQTSEKDKRMNGRVVVACTTKVYVNEEADMSLFKEMGEEGVRPDSITFLFVLSSCGRKGIVDMSMEVHNSMNKPCPVEPSLNHYSCMLMANPYDVMREWVTLKKLGSWIVVSASAKDTAFDLASRTTLHNGISKLADVGGLPLGLRGRNFILDENGTKGVNDGMTIARAIELLDPVGSTEVALIREVSNGINDPVGNGTATPSILHNIASMTTGFIGADLADLINEAALLAGKQNKVVGEKVDLIQAVAEYTLTQTIGPSSVSPIVGGGNKKLIGEKEEQLRVCIESSTTMVGKEKGQEQGLVRKEIAHHDNNKTLADSFSVKPLVSSCDNVLQNGGSQKLSDEVNEDTLENVVKLLAYISDKAPWDYEKWSIMFKDWNEFSSIPFLDLRTSLVEGEGIVRITETNGPEQCVHGLKCQSPSEEEEPNKSHVSVLKKGIRFLCEEAETGRTEKNGHRSCRVESYSGTTQGGGDHRSSSGIYTRIMSF